MEICIIIDKLLTSMVWSDIRLVKAKFQEQIPRKPDLNNIKIIIVA